VSRAVDELRRLPSLDRSAIDRVVHAAAAARLAEPEDAYIAPASRVRSIRLWSAIGLAAAAGVVGFLARGEWGGARTRSVAPAATVATTALAMPASATDSGVSARFAAVDPTAAAAVPSQFVFTNATAKRVSLVGDFNQWNPNASVMVRTASGVWSTVVPIFPGRHVYAFMVDDSLLVLDPRAPTVRDPDLGTDGSLRMVGWP
jgi:hypothetical protein